MLNFETVWTQLQSKGLVHSTERWRSRLQRREHTVLQPGKHSEAGENWHLLACTSPQLGGANCELQRGRRRRSSRVCPTTSTHRPYNTTSNNPRESVNKDHHANLDEVGAGPGNFLRTGTCLYRRMSPQNRFCTQADRQTLSDNRSLWHPVTYYNYGSPITMVAHSWGAATAACCSLKDAEHFNEGNWKH